MTSKLRDFLCHLASAWHEYKVCFSSSHCHESVSFLRTVTAFWNPGFLGCVLAKHLAQARSSHLYGVGIGHAPLLLCVLAPPTWPFFATSFMKLFLISSQLNGISAFPLIPHKRCTFSWNFFWICLLASCLSSDCRLFRAQFFAFLFWSLGTPEYSSLHNGHETDI